MNNGLNQQNLLIRINVKLGSAHIDLHQSHPAKLPLRLKHSFRNNQVVVWLKKSTYTDEDRIFLRKKYITETIEYTQQIVPV